jgi:L-ascorbate metabolism protein UlaG (beta-lactamase superfamily)
VDIDYKGGNCITIAVKKTLLCVDPKLSELGLKSQTARVTAQLCTQHQFKVESDESIVIDGPGEYEVENISIKGIPAQSHIDTKDTPKTATVYRVDANDLSVAIVGHIYPELSEAQLEAIGVVDVLVLPVGGNGYTLDSIGAVKVVKMIDPKVVIPTHYAENGVNYPIPQADVDGFIKDLSAPVEVMTKAKLKPGGLPEALTIYHITRTA